MLFAGGLGEGAVSTNFLFAAAISARAATGTLEPPVGKDDAYSHGSHGEAEEDQGSEKDFHCDWGSGKASRKTTAK